LKCHASILPEKANEDLDKLKISRSGRFQSSMFFHLYPGLLAAATGFRVRIRRFCAHTQKNPRALQLICWTMVVTAPQTRVQLGLMNGNAMICFDTHSVRRYYALLCQQRSALVSVKMSAVPLTPIVSAFWECSPPRFVETAEQKITNS